MAPRSRDEKALRRRVLVALGSMPDVLVMVNEANVFTQLLDLVTDKNQAFRRILPEERHGLGIGSPDLVCVVGGLFLGLELKREATDEHREGQLSADQRVWRDKAARAGVVYRCVRSVEEAVAAVEEVRGR